MTLDLDYAWAKSRHGNNRVKTRMRVLDIVGLDRVCLALGGLERLTRYLNPTYSILIAKIYNQYI